MTIITKDIISMSIPVIGYFSIKDMKHLVLTLFGHRDSMIFMTTLNWLTFNFDKMLFLSLNILFYSSWPLHIYSYKRYRNRQVVMFYWRLWFVKLCSRYVCVDINMRNMYIMWAVLGKLEARFNWHSCLKHLFLQL